MAKRPIFISDIDSNNFTREETIEFKWYPGFSKTQKQKSIKTLHEEFLKENPKNKILEISTSSDNELGIKLSAFNLMIKDNLGKNICSVESLFQGSKKFENAGPFKELINKSSVEAKKDIRLKTSGKLISFIYKNEEWPLNPKTCFYDWIYMNALHQNHELGKEIINYDSFSDIEFNPNKSINCQARSVALYVSLCKMGIIDKMLHNKEYYISFVNQEKEMQITWF